MKEKQESVQKWNKIIQDYLIITLAAAIITVGVYFFKFPNNFTFGGVTGMAVVVRGIFHVNASNFNNIVNLLLLGVGFLFLGKGFGAKTVYVTVVSTVMLDQLNRRIPLEHPLTSEPMLELIFAIALPAVGAAILFTRGASSGGTDIIAMILKKYTGANIGTALLYVDVLITVSACFVFDITTGLFCMVGLLAKSLVIDNVIESVNQCKYFQIVCENPQPICQYIIHTLNHSATVVKGYGAYFGDEKYVISTVLRRGQALRLRSFVRSREPHAFIIVLSSSEIIGKGFMTDEVQPVKKEKK